ncbi:MAG TPA: hypothetical protein VKW70_07880 [Terriglobia bacterium]|nr:hypothetical protein [Terriglobia bacterium]
MGSPEVSRAQKCCSHVTRGLWKQPSSLRVEELARRWAGWRSYATFYLWLTYGESLQWKKELRQEIAARKRRTER